MPHGMPQHSMQADSWNQASRLWGLDRLTPRSQFYSIAELRMAHAALEAQAMHDHQPLSGAYWPASIRPMDGYAGASGKPCRGIPRKSMHPPSSAPLCAPASQSQPVSNGQASDQDCQLAPAERPSRVLRNPETSGASKGVKVEDAVSHELQSSGAAASGVRAQSGPMVYLEAPGPAVHDDAYHVGTWHPEVTHGLPTASDAETRESLDEVLEPHKNAGWGGEIVGPPLDRNWVEDFITLT